MRERAALAPTLIDPVAPLPTDMRADQVGRVRWFALVSGGLWLLATVMEAWVTPRASGAAPSLAAVAISFSAALGGVGAWLYLSRARLAIERKVDVGPWLAVSNAAHVALLEVWARGPGTLNPGQPSWIMMVILLTAVIAPSTPRRVAFATAVAASMGPLAVALARATGRPVPSLATAALVYLPNYLWAAAAVIPSMIVDRVGGRLRAARELGSYALVERLGAGGMGEVWRARHRLLARDAAIKLIRLQVLGAATADQARNLLRRFEREAQATAQLQSAHSIRVFDFGATEDERFYYAMELLAGRDLESLVQEFGPVRPERVVFLLRQVCHSLAEAHAGGLIHRDVKPANIYVCRMGLEYDFVKVLDFGLVTFRVDHAHGSAPTLLTDPGTALGTPAYMAPEVILGGEVDRRVDVYALGCVAYFMLTGLQVFEGGPPTRAYVHHVHTQPTPPSQLAPQPVPPDLEALVLACLEKDPARRPQDAGELLLRCEACHLPRRWSPADASRWWHTHLSDLTGPLTFGVPADPGSW